MVSQMVACPTEELRTAGLRKEVGRPGQSPTGQVRMAFQMEAAGERWTRLRAFRSPQRPWQLAARRKQVHQRAGRQREVGQRAHQQEECRTAAGRRRLQMEEVQRVFRSGEGEGCSRLPS